MFAEINTFLNNLIWGNILIYLLPALGIFFTISSRFVQFRYFFKMFNILRGTAHDNNGHISSFQALMLSVSGRVGVGNIAGVAVAITLGGPGAVFWMWLIALVGMATSFFECSLAQLYKEKDGMDVLADIFFYAVFGEFVSPEDLERFKWYGIYAQDEKQKHFILRVPLSMGELNLNQIKILSFISKEFSDNSLLFLDEQKVEFRNSHKL